MHTVGGDDWGPPDDEVPVPVPVMAEPQELLEGGWFAVHGPSAPGMVR